MKILLVKLSSLGDVVHTLPVVQDILAAMPDAQVDWVVENAFAPLLSLSAGLHRVIPCEIRRWRKSIWSAATRREWRAFKAQLQLEAYDAVIDLQGLSKSAVVSWLARLAPGGKRYAMANQTEGSAYEAPTRWVADVALQMQPHIHAVQRSRELASRALGHAIESSPNFGLNLPVVQSSRLHFAIKNVAFIHGTSRADKAWPIQHWVELGQRLNASGHRIVLVHGNASELAVSQAIGQQLGAAHCVVWPQMSLDELTRQLAQCAGVIGVDSGVSHIAVALGLPHVQIYNFDTAWRTGPEMLSSRASADGSRQRSVFAQPEPAVDAVWRVWQACAGSPP